MAGKLFSKGDHHLKLVAPPNKTLLQNCGEETPLRYYPIKFVDFPNPYNLTSRFGQSKLELLGTGGPERGTMMGLHRHGFCCAKGAEVELPVFARICS